MPNPIQAAADIGMNLIADLIERDPQADISGEGNIILTRGAKGEAVAILQAQLNRHGAQLLVDGDFGAATLAAVKQFQHAAGLWSDGKVGSATRAALVQNHPFTGRFLNHADFVAAAELLGCDVSIVQAVAEVESAGSGFLADGRAKILFERHKFYAFYKQRYGQAAADKLANLAPHICNKKSGGYKGGAAEYARYNAAASYDADCSALSASWGRFQIMGFNHVAAGFDNVHAFVAAMSESEGLQLQAFCRFIIAHPAMHKALKAKKWAAFAAAYNGPNYKINHYDSKLAQAYARYAQ